MASETAWRCSLCGYVHQGDGPPDTCPICGAAASEFEAYEEPAAAPAAAATSWRCLNCAYIHDGSSPPDCCPVCGVGPDEFEALAEVHADRGTSNEDLRVLIVGGGIAGVAAAESIRKASTTASVTLVSQEDALPYYRLNLTRYLAGEIDATALSIHPAAWYAENRISLCLGRTIDALSTESQTVSLDDGTTESYDRLILAMGSHPFVPPIDGADLDGVSTLRTAADAEAILARIERGVPCVCIGGGILGLETAGALAQRGADVTLLESHDWLMPRQLTPEAAAVLETHVARVGVKLKKSARTEAIAGVDGRVAGLQLRDGERIDCGMVILCTGVRSNTYLARKAGLGVDRGVIVNNYLTTSDPHILAAGDVAEHNGVVYGVWGPSQYQGSIAGLNALGIATSFGGLPRSNALKVLGVDLASIGRVTAEDGSDLVIEEQAGDIFRRFLFRDSRLAGCILIGDIALSGPVKHAIEGRRNFSSLLHGTPTCDEIAGQLAGAGKQP